MKRNIKDAIAPYVSKSYIRNNSGIFSNPEKLTFLAKHQWVRVASFYENASGIIVIGNNNYTYANRGSVIAFCCEYTGDYEYVKCLTPMKYSSFGKMRIVRDKDKTQYSYIEFFRTWGDTSRMYISLLSNDAQLLDTFPVYDDGIIDGVLIKEFDLFEEE